MNDFDPRTPGDFEGRLSGAIGARASAAPAGRPDFSAVLADRQQRVRRRTMMAAVAILAVGVTGIATFAVGGGSDSTSTADGPDPSNGHRFFATTTALDVPFEGGDVGENIWYCQGAIDRFAAFPTTTTIAPATTLSAGTAGPAAEPDEYVPPLEDSGYFRDCHLVQADGEPTATYVDQFPTTTTADVPEFVPVPGASSDTGSQMYVVQTGDYAIKVADMFCVPLQDLIDFNGWATGEEFPFPGDEIKIPPGGCLSAAAVTTTTTTTTTTRPGG